MRIKQFLGLSVVLLITISFIISGCSKEDKKTDTTEKKKDTTKTSNTGSNTSSTGKQTSGKELFYMKSTINNIACADCHSDGSNSANSLTKFFSNIQGASKRTSTYHGKFTGEEVVQTAGGATVCWESYMKMKTPMTDEQIKSLNEYYESVAGKDSQKEIIYETIALPVRDKAKLKVVQGEILKLTGDPVKGETTFKNACGFCHGENSTVKKIPHLFEEFEGNVKSITYNVRLGDGGMPFYNSSVLSNQELSDIAAYILKKNGQ